MELQQHIGEEKVRAIMEKINPLSLKFAAQNPGTKLKLANENFHKMMLYKGGMEFAVDSLEETGAENEYLKNKIELVEEENTELKEKFHYSNPSYIRRINELQSVVSMERHHAKRILASRTYQNKIENKK